MLVGSDALAHVVCLAIELALILLGEMAVVLGHIFLFVILQPLFAALEAGGLSGRQLSVLHAIGDPILLIGLASIDLIHARVPGINLTSAGAGSVAGLGLSSGGSDNHQTTHCQGEE